jgi:hypothetical protein
VLLSSLSAVAATLAASACCLPTGALLAAVGLAGASRYQPWLMAFSAIALAIGVILAVRAKQCSPRRRRVNLSLLAVSSVIVLPVLVAPQATAAFLADLAFLRAPAPSRQPPLADLELTRFRDAFNAAAGDRRVIAIFSPT